MKKSVQIMQPFWITMEANKEQTTTTLPERKTTSRIRKNKKNTLEKVESEFDLSVQ